MRELGNLPKSLYTLLQIFLLNIYIKSVSSISPSYFFIFFSFGVLWVISSVPSFRLLILSLAMSNPLFNSFRFDLSFHFQKLYLVLLQMCLVVFIVTCPLCFQFPFYLNIHICILYLIIPKP